MAETRRTNKNYGGLREENESMRAEIKDNIAHIRKQADEIARLWKTVTDSHDVIMALRDENARLKEALMKIGFDFSANRDEAAIIARKELRKG